jgi:hypothetical protein
MAGGDETRAALDAAGSREEAREYLASPGLDRAGPGAQAIRGKSRGRAF